MIARAAYRFLTSLRGRRLKGKGKGVLGARETRGARTPRVSLAPKTPFPFPFKRLPHRLVSNQIPCPYSKKLLIGSNKYFCTRLHENQEVGAARRVTRLNNSVAKSPFFDGRVTRPVSSRSWQDHQRMRERCCLL